MGAQWELIQLVAEPELDTGKLLCCTSQLIVYLFTTIYNWVINS